MAIAYASTEGPFAQEMTELDYAIQWLVRMKQGASVDCYGGYYGPAYRYGGLIFVVDPGHESQKYAGLDAWKEEDVLKLYHDYQKACLELEEDYWDDFFDLIFEAQFPLEEV